MFSNRPHFGLILGVGSPCSVNNFCRTIVFLNLNSSCESRGQELQNNPFNFYESNLYHGEILVASGPMEAKFPDCARARTHAAKQRISAPVEPIGTNFFTMIEVRFTESNGIFM